MLSLLPKYLFPKVTDITPAFLAQNRISLLLMDFDNTLLPYTDNTPPKELLVWLDSMKRAGIGLCVVTNSKKPRVPTFCKAHNIPCVTRAKKPRTNGIRTALKRLGGSTEGTALVGDQIYTDVLAGNLSGVATIHVRSIHNHTVWLKLRHLLEVPVLAMAKKRRVVL